MLKTKHALSTLLLGMTFISGCAHDKNPANPLDPYEHFNRRTYAFNNQIDKIIYRPVARVYDAVLPWPIKKGVSNFFGNINEIPNFANDLLQLEPREMAIDFCRFAINSTIGIGGLFDVATKMGLERNYEDFGLTLAKWGAKKSPYFVIPFLGPSSVRDAIGFPVNYFGLSPWLYIQPPELSWSLQALRVVDIRQKLLPGDKVVNESFDPYVFVRDAYLQRRDALMEEENHHQDPTADTFVSDDSHTAKHVHRRHKAKETSLVHTVN
jgi:phospholipid-binding lipoprotein MlaA